MKRLAITPALKNYLKAALDEVGTKVQVEVTGETQRKKKN